MRVFKLTYALRMQEIVVVETSVPNAGTYGISSVQARFAELDDISARG